jgi:hypothetical protein
MKTRTPFTTPVGRLVSGSAHKAKTIDASGRPLVIKNGPKTGQPRVEFYIGLAIRKDDPAWPALDAAIKAIAAADFGPAVPQSPKFAWKITDGDSAIPNEKGKRPCDREGYPGHWILNFSGGTIPRCYRRDDLGALHQCEATEIKTGYYIRVAGNVTGNGDGAKPGVYLNHDMVELVAFGPEIAFGPDANEAFGAPAVAPVGASPMPVAAGPAPVAPHTAFLAGPPPAPPVAPAPERFAHNGSVYTREQLAAAGWNDTQINSLPRA